MLVRNTETFQLLRTNFHIRQKKSTIFDQKYKVFQLFHGILESL